MLGANESRADADGVSKFKAALRLLAQIWTNGNLGAWLKITIVVLVLKWGVIDLYRIPSDSMAPTLRGDLHFLRQDWVVVNKLAFGLRIPFSNRRILPWGEPKRWDVVVFGSVDRSLPDQRMIKRIAGLPEEKVVLYMRKLYINNEPVTYTHASGKEQMYSRHTVPLRIEVARTLLRLAQRTSLPEEFDVNKPRMFILRNHLAKLRKKIRRLDIDSMHDDEVEMLTSHIGKAGFQIVRQWMVSELIKSGQVKYGVRRGKAHRIVPRNRYYVLGDNPGHSRDSRFFGWVPRDHLYGRAYAVVWPPARIRDISGFSSTTLGKALLFGIPGILMLYEMIREFVATLWTVRKPNRAFGLRRGERVIINKIAFGLRLPFISARRPSKRGPNSGELIAYRQRGRWSPIALGRVKSSSEDGQTYTLWPLGENDDAVSLSRRQIVGGIRGVCWPPWRLRKLI